MNQTPECIAKMVHYRSYGTPNGEYPSVCRAAVITEIDPENDKFSESVGLCVLNPTGMFFNQHVPHDSYDQVVNRSTWTPGTWHWPCH